MKILIISQYFYPETFRINDLTRELKARGHGVTVLTGQPNYPQGKIYAGYNWWRLWRDEFAGVRVLRVPIIPRGRGGKLRLILNYMSFVLSALVFGLPRLRGTRYDVCLVFATSPITAALPANFYRALTGCPVAIWIQDLWPEVVASVSMVKSERVMGWIGRLVRWIYRRADKLLIQSEGFRPSVLKWGGQESQIQFLPNWAEDFYLPRPKATHSAFRILFAGNLGRAQSFETVLAAIEIIRQNHAPIEWHFMGDGTLKEWLEEQIALKGLEAYAKVLPRQPETQMPETFSRYSALLASLAKDPVLSLVLPSKIQSSMACAMPMLASADGEMARVVLESGCGLVSAAEDAQGLAGNAIKLSRLTPAELGQMGLNGRQYYERNFLREKLMRKFCSTFEEMAQTRRPS